MESALKELLWQVGYCIKKERNNISKIYVKLVLGTVMQIAKQNFSDGSQMSLITTTTHTSVIN